MTSILPPTAASGIPPPTTFPKVTRSGTQAARSCQSAPGQEGAAASAGSEDVAAAVSAAKTGRLEVQPSTDSSPHQPAGPTRKPVRTSSRIMSAPCSALTRRIAALKPGAGGTIPILAGAPSVMSAAISAPRSAKQASRAATSL